MILAPGRHPGEFVFVPETATSPEGEGWMIGFVVDIAAQTTDLVILGARRFEAAPVASIHLPHRVPPGFHGNWLSRGERQVTTPYPVIRKEMHPMDRARIIAWLRQRAPRLVLELAINFAAPVLIYDQLHGRWGDLRALLASSGPPLVWSIFGFLRNRRVDALSVLSMVGITLSVLAFFGGGSAQFLQLREKLVTLLIGLAFLGSAAIGKPLIYPLARATVARESAEALASFEARREHPLLRQTVMVMTLVWGFGLLADVAISIILIYALPITAYLIVGPILGYATMGWLTLWTVLYRRYRTRLAAQIRARTE